MLVTFWTLTEIVKDQELFKAVREEVLQSYETDHETGELKINAQKLISGPLIQSIHVEIMRMHVSFNVTCDVLQDIEMDGYTVEKGAMLQASSQIAHFEESVWATEEHPASEFFATRHIKYVDHEDEFGNKTKKAQFSMKGRPSSFFPYGEPWATQHQSGSMNFIALCFSANALLFQAEDMLYAPGGTLLNKKYSWQLPLSSPNSTWSFWIG